MSLAFFVTFLVLIVAELVKGLSANGTPPVLQKFSWQMDLAYVMWTNIVRLRILLGALLIVFFVLMPNETKATALLVAVPLALLWGGIYWVFNRFWVGKYKFLPITQKTFAAASDNKVDLQMQVLGVSEGGVQKAFPVNMLFYHHQITDEIAGKPIWVTYCGLCRSGRIYDINLDGTSMEFGLVGAITYNAVFRDTQTGSWWRQETGEAAKGPMAGRALQDVAFEQMSLENWLEKYPGSTVLQYDPTFQKKYMFLAKLIAFEASLPGWHRQETPPLILGVEVGEHATAYDWNTLKNRRFVMDAVGGTPLLAMSDPSGSTGFVYDRRLDGDTLEFERDGDLLRDLGTGSTWDHLGRCTSGARQGAQLEHVQSYQQFLRAWVSFHPQTTFFAF